MAEALPDFYQRRADDFLMPFGNLAPRAVLDAQHYAALGRAAAKLETLQSGRGFVPAGPCYALVRDHLARGAVLVIPFGLLAALFTALGGTPVAIFFGTLALFALGWLARSLHAATPRTPQDALKTFYALLAAERFGEAFDRAVRCDRDDSPMRPNDIPTLGEPAPGLSHLDQQNLTQYWQTLLFVTPSPWLEIRLHNFKANALCAGLWGVEFDIEFIIRNRQWLWLTLLGILPGYALALILSYWTSIRVRGHLHKLVYEMSGECQLFNAEFQGSEEFDLSWLGSEVLR